MKLRLLVGAVLIAACGPAPASEEPAPTVGGIQPSDAETARATRDFTEVREGFLPWYYRARPVRASAAGIHAHDDRLPDLSRAGIQLRIDSLLHWLGEFDEIPFAHLRGEDRFDYGALEYAIRSELLDLEEVRRWVRDPTLYTGAIADGLESLIGPSAVPLDEPVPALRARLEAAPRLLEAARQNLARPPELWTRRGMSHAEDLIVFLEAGLPSDLGPARDRLAAALREYRDWLETDLLPRSTGEYRLGRYLFERKLLYNEHIVLEAPELDRINAGMMAEYRRALESTAAVIDQERSARQILDSLAARMTSPEEALDRARELTVSLRDWTVATGVVTVPETDPPSVRRMPPYRREVSSLDVAAGLEESGAYFTLGVPGPDWAAERRQARMHRFSSPELVGMAARHTFPGRFVQLGHERQLENPVRQLFTARSFLDGWAHYAEGMAVEEGFGDGDPAIRLSQLRRALEQHARWSAALQIHALGVPFEEVVRGFMEGALVDEGTARAEVIRATYDPLYLAAALGRLQIIELRNDYRQWVEGQGEPFVLRDFHDRLLRLALPLPLAREVMLPMSADGGAARGARTR